MDPVPDPILPEKFPGYSWESNPEPLGWQSDVLTTIPNRRSLYKYINIGAKDDWNFRISDLVKNLDGAYI